MHARTRSSVLPLLLLLLLCAFQCAYSGARGRDTKISADHEYDVVVYGSTPAGCAAAISAAMFNPLLRIALVEPTQYIGGMSVAGGIGLRDVGNETTIVNTIGYKWAMTNAKQYWVNYPVMQPDMPVGEESWWQMFADYPNIGVVLNYQLVEGVQAVNKSGTVITSLAMMPTNSRMEIVKGADPVYMSAKQFIDASYEGDIPRFAGVSYTFGRESAAQYKETYAGVRPYYAFGNFIEKFPTPAAQNGSQKLLPYVDPETLPPIGSADDRMMGYAYRLCITLNVTKQAPFYAPEGYDRNDFILVERYVQNLVESGGRFKNGPTLLDMTHILPYQGYPGGDKFDMVDSQSSAVTTDAINLNRGYVEASYAQRKQIAKDTLYYDLGFVYFLATDPAIPQYTRDAVNVWALCNDQWEDNGYIPPQMYVREGLRITGDKVYTQNDLTAGVHIPDSIALGSWFYDIHVVSRTAVQQNGTYVAYNEGQLYTDVAGNGNSYEIPMSILLPKRAEATNLLVPVCNSASHVTYSSVRVEPVFAQLGESSGLIAALAIQNNVAVQDVYVQAVQKALAARGINVHC